MAWITDMTHFLDPVCRIPKMPARAARIADSFGGSEHAATLPVGY